MEAVNIFSDNLEGRVDVASAVGSAATAMFIYDLAPGQSQCPYHYEYEEEWLLVIDGTIVVRAHLMGITLWGAETSSASRPVLPERTSC